MTFPEAPSHLSLPYEPRTDVEAIKADLVRITAKKPEELTDDECFGLIADVATRFRTEDTDGWIFANLPVIKNREISVAFCPRTQEVAATVYNRRTRQDEEHFMPEYLLTYRSVTNNQGNYFYTQDHSAHTPPEPGVNRKNLGIIMDALRTAVFTQAGQTPTA